MRKYIILLLVILIMILVQPVLAEENELANTEWIDYISYSSLKFSQQDLSLPEGDYKDFSRDARIELMDLASLYSEGLTESDNNNNIMEIEGLTFNPLPGITLDTDYGQKLQEMEVEKWTNINLQYQLNPNMMFRAGVDMANSKSIELKQLPKIDNSDGADGEGNTGEDENNDSLDGIGSENIRFDQVVNEDETRKKKIGVSYQTSDHVTISADYITDNEILDTKVNSKVLGIKYTDEKGAIIAKYQVDEGEDGKGRITGLELAVPDLATISASYKLLDPDFLAEKLTEETIWDFGVDVNLTDISKVSIGYQFRNEKNSEEDEEKEDKESSIKASFEINF